MSILRALLGIALLAAGNLAVAAGDAPIGRTLTVEGANGLPFPVYAVGPVRAGEAILFLHDGAMADGAGHPWANRLAALGYRVVVVGVNPKATPAVADAPRTTLHALKIPGRRVAVIGWRSGAPLALETSLAEPQTVAATMIYYGAGPLVTDPGKLAALGGPVLNVVAEKDLGEAALSPWAFLAAMRAAGKSTELHVFNTQFRGVDPSNPKYEPATADALWRVTVGFLEANLK